MPKFAKPWFRPSRGVWYITLGGKQYRLGPCTEEQAIERAVTLKKQLQRDIARPAASDGLPVVVDAFLEWLHRQKRAPDTYEWYRYRLERLARRYPDLPASRLTSAMVEDWVDELDLSTTSRRNYYRAVKKCFKWARSRRLIRRNLVRDLVVPNAESREVVVSAQQYEQLLSLIRDPAFRDLVVTTWETGCRPQESLRVEARHVDLTNQRWVFPKSESKNKKRARVVYLTDKAAEITRRLMVAHPTGKLFRNSAGTPWTVEAVNCAFVRIQVRAGKRAMQERKVSVSEEEVDDLVPLLNPERTEKRKPVPKTPAELRAEARRKLTNKVATSLAPKWSLYALRHTWATNALEKGLDPLTTAILMGHSDPSTLSKVYQHVALNPAHMLGQAKRARG